MSLCRPTDIVGRYGGEEFAVLLLDPNSRGAFFVAERMLSQIRNLRLEHARRPQRLVTISLGVASLISDSDQVTPDDLVEAADRALYRAK
jgi:two-component system chemotaxis family response regulator WspR